MVFSNLEMNLNSRVPVAQLAQRVLDPIVGLLWQVAGRHHPRRTVPPPRLIVVEYAVP